MSTLPRIAGDAGLDAVQLHGARGVARGECVERLYREIRALRIYEGATEVQRLVIGRELLRPLPPGATHGLNSCSTCRSCNIRRG